MKFFQKTGVAVAITVLAIAAALFIGLSPVLKSGAETAPVQTVSSQDTSAQTSSASLPASESTASGTAGDETISNKYIRDEAGLFTRSAENTIKDYNDKIYSKTGSHVAILTTADTGGMSLESYTNSAFDAMGLSEYDMLFSVDTDTQTWYVTTGAYVADFADSRLESIFKDGFAAILDTDADEAAKDLYKDLYSWCKSNLTGAAAPQAEEPVQQTGYGRRKSVIGTIITILIIYWILKAIFGSGRRGGGGGFWSGLFLGSLFSNRHHGPGPGPGPRPGGFGGVRAPAASAEGRGRAAARAAALAADGAASAADGGKVRSEKFSRIAALLADILIPNLMKEEYFV